MVVLIVLLSIGQWTRVWPCMLELIANVWVGMLQTSGEAWWKYNPGQGAHPDADDVVAPAAEQQPAHGVQRQHAPPVPAQHPAKQHKAAISSCWYPPGVASAGPSSSVLPVQALCPQGYM